jgi:hypothetical protein
VRTQRFADGAEHSFALALDRLGVERPARVSRSEHADAEGVLGEGISLLTLVVLLELVNDLGVSDVQGKANSGCILVGGLRGDVGDGFHGIWLLRPRGRGVESSVNRTPR